MNRVYKIALLIFLYLQIIFISIVPLTYCQINGGSWRYEIQSTSISAGSNDIDISDDGNYIIAGNVNKIYFFHRNQSTPIWIYETDYVIHSVSISSDGSLAAACTGNGTIYCFKTLDYTNNIYPFWYYSVNNMMHIVDISSDGSFVVAGGEDQSIFLFNNTNLNYQFNKSTFTPLHTYLTNASIYTLDISSDGKYIIVGASNEVILLNRTNLDFLWKHADSSMDIIRVTISDNGSYMAASSYDGYLYFFNHTSSIPEWNVSTSIGYFRGLDISGDGEYLVAVSSHTRLHFFNRSSSQPEWVYNPHAEIGKSVAISYNGSYFAAGVQNITSNRFNKVLFFNTSETTPKLELNVPAQTEISLDISADGRFIAVKSGLYISLYDLLDPFIASSSGTISLFIIPGLIISIVVIFLIMFKINKKP
ncbi:MAG: WD40 repeat domain-containing protein [Promethearchaeota archaeon]